MALPPFFCHNGDHLTTPPPAHCGIPPYQLDPKTMGLTRPTIYPFPTSQYAYPMLSPDMSQVATWHTPSVYSAASGFRSPYPSSLPINTSLPSDFYRFSPSLLPSVHTHHHVLNSHPAIVTPGPKQEIGPETNHRYGRTTHDHQKNSPGIQSESKESNEKKKPHIKKPLNAFMLYMKEMRAKVVAECTLKESAAINQILGRRWHALGREEQAKYYELARRERQLHMQLYPDWSSRANTTRGKKRKRKQDPNDGGNNMKKCRARYGLDQQNQWCKPCRRKKKCIRYMESEGDDAHDIENNVISDDNLGSCGSVDEAQTPEDDNESINHSISSPGGLSALSSLQSPSTSLASPLNLLASPSTPNQINLENSQQQHNQHHHNGSNGSLIAPFLTLNDSISNLNQNGFNTTITSITTNTPTKSNNNIKNFNNNNNNSNNNKSNLNSNNNNTNSNNKNINNNSCSNNINNNNNINNSGNLTTNTIIAPYSSTSSSSSSTSSLSSSASIPKLTLAATGCDTTTNNSTTSITISSSSAASTLNENMMFDPKIIKLETDLIKPLTQPVSPASSSSLYSSIGSLKNSLKNVNTINHLFHQQQLHPFYHQQLASLHHQTENFYEKVVRNPVGANPRDINNPLSVNQLTKRDYMNHSSPGSSSSSATSPSLQQYLQHQSQQQQHQHLNHHQPPSQLNHHQSTPPNQLQHINHHHHNLHLSQNHHHLHAHHHHHHHHFPITPSSTISGASQSTTTNQSTSHHRTGDSGDSGAISVT